MAQLLAASERFAGYLAGRVQPGDAVAVILRNRAEFMVAWLAVVANRAVLVSVNPDDKILDAGHILRDSASVIVILTEEHESLIDELRPELARLREVITVRRRRARRPGRLHRPASRCRFAQAECARGDISNIYYTSGTTGMPKGCMADHEWWLRTVDVMLRRIPQTPSDRVLCCLQFFYSDPGHLLLECLATGGALVVMRRFSVSRFWDVVRDHRVTLILSFSSIPLFLLKAPPDPRDRDNKVRVARHLAMPPDLHRQVVERWGFPWIEGYGITEGNVVTSMPLEYADEMTGSGSIGIPVPEVDAPAGRRRRRGRAGRGDRRVRDARPWHVPRLPRPPRGHQRRPCPTGGCAPATWAARTSAASCTSWAARRTSSAAAGRT